MCVISVLYYCNCHFDVQLVIEVAIGYAEMEVIVIVINYFPLILTTTLPYTQTYPDPTINQLAICRSG